MSPLYTNLQSSVFNQKTTFLSIPGTLTRRHSRRKSSNSTDDSSGGGTLKRQTSYKTRGSLDSMGGRSGASTPLCGTPVRERASPFAVEREVVFGERPPSAGSVRSPLAAATNSIGLEMPSCMVCRRANSLKCS